MQITSVTTQGLFGDFSMEVFFNGARNIARFPGNQKSVSTILDTPLLTAMRRALFVYSSSTFPLYGINTRRDFILLVRNSKEISSQTKNILHCLLQESVRRPYCLRFKVTFGM